MWTLYGDEENDQIREDRRHPILIVAITFFLAEFGDKTMFSTAALAATHAWFPVWVGSHGRDGAFRRSGRLGGAVLGKENSREDGAMDCGGVFLPVRVLVRGPGRGRLSLTPEQRL